jgi:hypothetical protein
VKVKTPPGPAERLPPSLEKGTRHSRVSGVESVYVNKVMPTRLLRFVLRVCRNLRFFAARSIDRSTRSRRLLCFIREGNNVSDYWWNATCWPGKNPNRTVSLP